MHRVNEFTIAAELVRIEAGVALLPRWTAATPDGVVRVRLRGGVRAARHIDALTRPENLARPAVPLVIARLRRTAGRLAAPTAPACQAGLR